VAVADGTTVGSSGIRRKNVSAMRAPTSLPTRSLPEAALTAASEHAVITVLLLHASSGGRSKAPGNGTSIAVSISILGSYSLRFLVW